MKDKAKGTIKMSGKIEMGGIKADMTLQGPFTINSSSKPKDSK